MKAKTLAMLKMEKNLVAVIDKGYTTKPYELDLDYLRMRLLQEVNELNEALKSGQVENAKSECADVSNIVDYIFEKLSNEKEAQHET